MHLKSLQLNTLDAPTEFKFAAEGVVEGYASIFGNVDSGGDVVLPGAYKEFQKTRDGKVLMLYQHDARSPIGKADVSQDSKGLHFRAELMMEDATAKRAYAHMKAGVLDGMSVGYQILPGGSVWKDDRRELSALRLMEVSAVTFGMNTLAHVETVKSATDCANVRELEGLLRERLGVSKRKATAAASQLWPLLTDREGREGDREDRQKADIGKARVYAAFLSALNDVLTKGNQS